MSTKNMTTLALIALTMHGQPVRWMDGKKIIKEAQPEGWRVTFEHLYGERLVERARDANGTFLYTVSDLGRKWIV
jgi:hypothetical protein